MILFVELIVISLFIYYVILIYHIHIIMIEIVEFNEDYLDKKH